MGEPTNGTCSVPFSIKHDGRSTLGWDPRALKHGGAFKGWLLDAAALAFSLPELPYAASWPTGCMTREVMAALCIVEVLPLLRLGMTPLATIFARDPCGNASPESFRELRSLSASDNSLGSGFVLRRVKDPRSRSTSFKISALGRRIPHALGHCHYISAHQHRASIPSANAFAILDVPESANISTAVPRK